MSAYEFMAKNQDTTLILAVIAAITACSLFKWAAIAVRGYPKKDEDEDAD